MPEIAVRRDRLVPFTAPKTFVGDVYMPRSGDCSSKLFFPGSFIFLFYMIKHDEHSTKDASFRCSGRKAKDRSLVEVMFEANLFLVGRAFNQATTLSCSSLLVSLEPSGRIIPWAMPKSRGRAFFFCESGIC